MTGTQRQSPMNENTSIAYDCIVIGGGPAGLSAAIMLARYGRRCLVFDDNKPRNGEARSIRGFLGQDGIAPKELLQKGRAEVQRYGGQIIDCTVDRLARFDDGFLVIASQTYWTRSVLLATGVRDTLPDIQGFSEFYGTSAHHCPDCDGYEVRDKHVAVLGDGRSPVGGLLTALSVWTAKLTLLLNGEPNRASDEDREIIAALKIGIAAKKVIALEGNGTARQLERIRFVDGDAIQCDALFFDLGLRPASSLAQDLGCELDLKTQLIKVSKDQQTTVSGVYAAGDVTPDSHMAVVAAAEGTLAAIQIHKSLLRAEAARSAFPKTLG